MNGHLVGRIHGRSSVKIVQRRKFFGEIKQPETIFACGVHVCYRIGTKCAMFIEDLPEIIPTKFRLIWLSSFRGED
jgi:hypothetical protein